MRRCCCWYLMLTTPLLLSPGLGSRPGRANRSMDMSSYISTKMDLCDGNGAACAHVTLYADLDSTPLFVTTSRPCVSEKQLWNGTSSERGLPTWLLHRHQHAAGLHRITADIKGTRSVFSWFSCQTPLKIVNKGGERKKCPDLAGS